MAALSMLLVVTTICFSFVFTLASAHPDEGYDKVAILKEVKARGLELMEQRAQYDECANSAEAIAREERAMIRRAAAVQRLREERCLPDG
jgi:hypothetical protein